MENLMDSLRKLNGLAPYNKPSNMLYGDPYLLKSIQNEYSKEEIQIALERINRK